MRRGGRVAIVHASVVPMDARRVLRDHTVVIEDGVIAAVGASSAFGESGLAGAEIVEAGGRYLMPGLADMHVHLHGPGDGALYVANGVTLVRNMAGGAFQLALGRRYASGELPGPRVVSTTPIIDGLPPERRLPGFVGLGRAEDAASLVGHWLDRGCRQVKVFNGL